MQTITTGLAATAASATTTAVAKTAGRDDSLFGPQLGSTFDFTLLFDHAILTIAPTVLLIAACPLYVYFKHRDPVQVNWDSLFWTKLTTALVLFLIQLAQLVLWAVSDTPSSEEDWAIGATAVSCVAALCIGLMLSIAHVRSIRPSALLSVYFFFAVFLDGIRARSYLLREGLDAIGAIQVVVTVAKFVLLILEEIPKTASLKDVNLFKFFGKEAFSGFWSRSLILWINETFILGFNNILTLNDLGNLGPEFSTERLVRTFEGIWQSVDKTKERALQRALLKQHWGALLLAAPARIGLSVCLFAQPFIVYHAVDMVDRTDATYADKNSLVFATALVYGGIGLFRTIYSYYLNRCIILVRGTILGKIYGKTLVLPSKKAAEGAALTHITSDVEAVELSIQQFHDLWICYFEIGFSIYFLYLYMGYACFLLFIAAAASTVWSWYFGPKLGDARKVWTKKIEKRVSESAKLLAQARQIKTLALTDIVTKYIHNLRNTELKFMSRYRWMHSTVFSMAMMLESVTPVIVVAGVIFLTKNPLPLESRRMFTILAFVSLSTNPMQRMLRSYSGLRDTSSCIDRISSYFAEMERHDQRTIRRQAPSAEGEKEKTADDLLASDIDITGATLSPADAEEAITDATVSIPHGKLTIAVGPTGSGKTTFLKSLLGEADVIKGQILVKDGPIAYCDDKPWIRNDTIRASITGHEPVDEAWYQSVLRYCCLLEDLGELPEGDRTLTGSNGSKLSGGQRLRVALARALNSRAQIMILDDIFSGLDRVTARRIFFGLFSSDGLLRRLRTTVILATHSLEFLDAADTILRFDENGTIEVEDGQGDQVLRHVDLPAVSISSASTVPEELNETPAKVAAVNSTEPVQGQPLDNAYHRGDWTLWLFFMKAAPKWTFVLFIFISCAEALAERMTSIFMRIWIDKSPDSKMPFAVYAVLGFSSTLTYLALTTLLFQKMLPSYAKYLHNLLVNTIFGANLVFLMSTDHAILVNRITQDMTLLTQEFSVIFSKYPYAVATALCDLGIVLSASYYTLILIPFLCLVFYIVQLVYLRTSRQLRILDLEAGTPLCKQVIEMSSGLEHIRAFHWEEEFLRQSFELVDMSQKPHYYMSSLQRWLTLVLDSINMILVLVLVVFAVFWDHSTTTSGIGLGFMGLLRLGEGLEFFVTIWTKMEMYMGTIARLRTFEQQTPQEVDDPRRVRVPASWPEQGVIEFKDVSATYSAENGRESVLRNVSFLVPANKIAGFIGRTGSGKSTIFLVLLGFLPYTGSVTIDGLEVSRISRKTLRSRVTAMPQDSLMLPGTIRQNLMPWLLNEKDPKRANQCSMLAISQVLEDTLLTDKILAAGNLDAPIENLGMSAGERQMFSIARSMLLNLWREAKIILMDEVSSHIDYETDKQIQWAIGEAFNGLTMCTIAHRMQSVEKAHMIFEVDSGVLSVHRADQEPINAEYMANYSSRW